MTKFKIAQEVSPLLSDFGNDIRLNANYLLKLKQYTNKSSFEPQPEQTTLLDEKYKSFLEMEPILRKTKNKLREIDKELSKTSLQFGENVLASFSNASYGRKTYLAYQKAR
jgi:peptidyl-dipeptidase Dcp